MYYTLELITLTMRDAYESGELTPLSYSLECYCRAVADDVKKRLP